MPKIILKNGTEFVVDQDILDQDILSKDSSEMIQLGRNFFKKSSIDIILEDDINEENSDSKSNVAVYTVPGTRLAAFVLDLFFLFFYAVVVGGVIGFLAGFTGNEALNAYVDGPTDYDDFVGTIIGASYFFFSFLIFKNTLGGKITKIRVVNFDGKEVSGLKLAFRGMLIGFPFGLGALNVFFDKKNRAIHDKMFGTVVVNVNSDYENSLQGEENDVRHKSFRLTR